MVNDNSNDENFSFWSRSNIGTILIIAFSIGIPVFLIVTNIFKQYNRFSVGFDIGNSIALLTAGLALTGTLYSNYQNDARNRKQIKAAEKRLDIQLKEQKQNLFTQLVFDKQREMVIKLYELFVQTGMGLYPKTGKKLSITGTSWGLKSATLNTIFKGIFSIRYTPNKFYSLPLDIQKKIIDLVENYETNIIFSSLPFIDPSIEGYLDEIFNLVENYLNLLTKY